MTGEVYEAGNRRAEIDGNVVSFLRVTGRVRRSIEGVWWTTCDDPKKARRLAKAWAFKAKLGKAVLH
jgi:hypothetical protein